MPNESGATGDSLTEWHRAVERLNVETCEAAEAAFGRGETAGAREFLWEPLRAFAAAFWRGERGERFSGAVLAGYWMLARAAKIWEAETRWREEHLETLTYGRSLGLVRREWVAALDGVLDGAGEGRAIAGGRGGAVRVATPEGAVVVRRFRRGGAMRWLRDHYFGWRPRPFRELSLLVRCRRRGLTVPEPVAALVERRSLGYRGLLVTREIAGATPLSALVDRGVDYDLAALLGAGFREAHDAGLDHPDLNLGNVLVLDRGYGLRLALVDLDRARLHRGPLGKRARSRNVRRFRRSAKKLDPAGRLLSGSTLDRVEAIYWNRAETPASAAERRGAAEQ